jgi:hypothetical protein
MKYSLILLILTISIFAQTTNYNPTNDLDKPSSANTGATLQIAHIGGLYFQNWTIQSIVSELINPAQGSWGDGLQAAALLKQDLTRYLNSFPACKKLLNYTLESGSTATFNIYTDSASANLTDNEVVAQDDNPNGVPCYRSIESGSNIIDAGGALKATIYTGRSTGSGFTHELTIKTSQGQYTVYTHDPIVLDLDGDGKLEASKGNYLPHDLCVPESELVAFDMNADGFDELVEWVGANDGLLVHDVTNNEVSGKNLFGDATGFKDGFEQLATLDANKDDALTGEELAGLAVWQDKNGNAKIDDGEIHSLESLGITKLNVKAIELTATFERNGKYYMMWDWNPVTIMVKKAK